MILRMFLSIVLSSLSGYIIVGIIDIHSTAGWSEKVVEMNLFSFRQKGNRFDVNVFL